MILRDLLAAVDHRSVRGATDREVSGLALDSRRVKPGDAFFALPGVNADGARFARAAVESGAVAVFSGGVRQRWVVKPDSRTGRRRRMTIAVPTNWGCRVHVGCGICGA